MTTQHTRDADCTLNNADTCVVCGVYHGDPCADCGERGFHGYACEANEGAKAHARHEARQHERLIAADLSGHGFNARCTRDGVFVTRSDDRPAQVWQVKAALDKAGYEPCQYTAEAGATGLTVIVRAE